MNLNIVEPEKFDNLRLVYNFTVPLRFKKISQKAVKVGGLLRYPVHTSLGHAGCF